MNKQCTGHFQDGETILCDTIMTDTYRCGYIKIHKTVQHRVSLNVNYYYHSQRSLDSKQTDFSVHNMTSLPRHFSVLIHTLELHTKNHVTILRSQKNFFRMFFFKFNIFKHFRLKKIITITWREQKETTSSRSPQIDIIIWVY